MKVSKLKILVSCFFLLSIVFASGCSRWCRFTAQPEQNYYPGVSKDLSTLGTVCIIELRNSTSYPQISRDVTESLYQELQKKHLFDLTLLQQNDPVWRNLQIRPDSPYTLEQLLSTRKILGVDSVLTGTVTNYAPYPHMMIGIQLKLIDLRDGQTVWAFEQIWDTADKTTEKRLKRYFQQELRQGVSPLGEQIAVLSTINFVRFVTYDAVETLQK